MDARSFSDLLIQMVMMMMRVPMMMRMRNKCKIGVRMYAFGMEF
jgi:hypothetical protein